MTQVTEADYLEAQNGDAKVRDDFVRAIDLEEAGQFINSYSYSDSQRKIRNSKSLFGSKLKALMTHWAIDDESRVLVYPIAFEKLSLPEFLSSLIDHEGQHARQLKLNEGGYSGIAIREDFPYVFLGEKNLDLYIASLTEIPAYANQIANIRRRNFNVEELRSVNDRIDSFLDYAEKFSKKKKWNRNLEEDLNYVLCNSPGDDWVREHILEKAA